jgi:hypothetical protein
MLCHPNESLHADVEVEHQEDGGLQSLGEIEGGQVLRKACFFENATQTKLYESHKDAGGFSTSRRQP